MNDQAIPADKVRELIEKFKEDTKHDCIVADLRALLPAPPQPTTGLLGRWAKHDAYGDVVVISDHPAYQGDVWVRYTDNVEPDGATANHVPLSSLTFPHQATKPADVPAGEAWLVDVKSKHGTRTAIAAIKDADGNWRTAEGKGTCFAWDNSEVTLIAPLTPERPVSDLQAKYDELNAKYREAQDRIKELEQSSTPRTVSTRADYAALPVGSIASQPDTLNTSHAAFKKRGDNRWEMTGSKARLNDRQMAQMSLTVLQYGRGDEQPEFLPQCDEQPKPAWRIEHDPKNLRVGEYIIDIDGDTGTIYTEMDGSLWCIGVACIDSKYSPFIVFPNEEAATQEAVAESKKARDKETGE